MTVQVFERGAGKWVLIDDDVRVTYTSDQQKATIFSTQNLSDAYVFFEDFVLYQKTMLAVPVGTNRHPLDCDTVLTYLIEKRKKRQKADSEQSARN